MNDQIVLRKLVREVLALAPSTAGKVRRFTERMLFDGVQRLLPEQLGLPSLRAAIEWNQERDYIEFEWEEDENENTWALTKKGRAKEAGK